MSLQTSGIAIVVFLALLIRYLNRTNTPKIKNLPEIPGVPLFGNLLQFGSEHPKVARRLAKKYGPVFQVRLGNKVSLLLLLLLLPLNLQISLNNNIANCLCKHLRLCPSHLDNQPILSHLPPNPPHLPHRGLFLPRLHNRHFALGRIMQSPTKSRSHSPQSTSSPNLHANHRSRMHILHQRNPGRQSKWNQRHRSHILLSTFCSQHFSYLELWD